MATEAIAKEAQRKSPRWQIVGSKPAKVDLGPAGTGILVNIGEGGIRVQALAPLRLNSELPVRIEMPEKAEPLRVSGVVVWSKANGAGGIRFNGLGENEKRILKAWLSDLEMGTMATTAAEVRDEFADIIAQIKSRNLNNAEALDLIVRRAGGLSSVHGAAIALGTPENMVCMATAGEAPEIGTHIPQSVGLTGECVRGRKLVHCQDTQKDPRVGAELSRKLNLGSAVVVPLMVNGDLRGVLEAFSPRSHAFDPASIETLSRLADAVVYITHGLLAQRKLATVTPMNSTATKMNAYVAPALSVPLVPSALPRKEATVPTAMAAPQPATAAIPVAPVFASPVVAKVEASAPTKAEPVAVAIAPTLAPTVEPRKANITVAPYSGAPPSTATPAKPTVTTPPQVATSKAGYVPSMAPPESDSNHRRVAYERLLGITEPEPPKSHAAVWMLAAIFALALGGGSYFFWWHHQQTIETARVNAAAQASAAIPSAATAVDPTVQASPENVAASNPAAPAIVQPSPAGNVVTAPPATATSVAKTSGQIGKTAVPELSEPKKDKPRGEVKNSETKSPETKAPAAEPILLAASVGRSKPATEPEFSAPTPIGVAVGSSVPGISLPSNSSVPKLTAAVSKTRTGGEVLKQVAPVYPLAAKATGLQGKVELQLHITKAGTVDKVRVISGNPILAGAATDAVKRWQYDPLKLDGEAIDMDSTVTLRFTLPR